MPVLGRLYNMKLDTGRIDQEGKAILLDNWLADGDVFLSLTRRQIFTPRRFRVLNFC
jgi:hypothetical protein